MPDLAEADKALVERAIAAWHDSGGELHQWLGWSWEEYAAWVRDPSAVPRVPKHFDGLAAAPVSVPWYAVREGLANIIAHFGDRSQAPGHCHIVPGIWDDNVSNGERAGTVCEWCAQWEAAKRALATAPSNAEQGDSGEGGR